MADEDPATMRHVVDGTRVKNGSEQPAAIIHQFIQFTNNQNTVQLPAEGSSIPANPDEQKLIEVPVWAKKQD